MGNCLVWCFLVISVVSNVSGSRLGENKVWHHLGLFVVFMVKLGPAVVLVVGSRLCERKGWCTHGRKCVNFVSKGWNGRYESDGSGLLTFCFRWFCGQVWLCRAVWILRWMKLFVPRIQLDEVQDSLSRTGLPVHISGKCKVWNSLYVEERNAGSVEDDWLKKLVKSELPLIANGHSERTTSERLKTIKCMESVFTRFTGAGTIEKEIWFCIMGCVRRRMIRSQKEEWKTMNAGLSAGNKDDIRYEIHRFKARWRKERFNTVVMEVVARRRGNGGRLKMILCMASHNGQRRRTRRHTWMMTLHIWSGLGGSWWKFSVGEEWDGMMIKIIISIIIIIGGKPGKMGATYNMGRQSVMHKALHGKNQSGKRRRQKQVDGALYCDNSIGEGPLFEWREVRHFKILHRAMIILIIGVDWPNFKLKVAMGQRKRTRRYMWLMLMHRWSGLDGAEGTFLLGDEWDGMLDQIITMIGGQPRKLGTTNNIGPMNIALHVHYQRGRRREQSQVDGALSCETLTGGWPLIEWREVGQIKNLHRTTIFLNDGEVWSSFKWKVAIEMPRKWLQPVVEKGCNKQRQSCYLSVEKHVELGGEIKGNAEFKLGNLKRATVLINLGKFWRKVNIIYEGGLDDVVYLNVVKAYAREVARLTFQHGHREANIAAQAIEQGCIREDYVFQAWAPKVDKR
ncbi:hypothetical protein V6N13_029633 [Hibiscus sabdariffa]